MSEQQVASRLTVKKGRQKPQSRFQRLWSEAAVLARENKTLERALNELVGRVSSEVLSAEREMGETKRRLVYRQLEFAGKKSLLKWQRAELNEWIEQNLSELMIMGLLDEDLQNKVALLRASELGIDIDEKSELSAAEQLDQFFGLDTDSEIEDFDLDNSNGKRSGATADMFGDDEDLDDTASLEFGDDSGDEEALAELLRKLRAEFDDFDNSTEVCSKQQTDNPDTDAVFKRLFRQTAAVLHPDKESDERQRTIKHGLMSQLLKARKERDLITIVKLHEEHSPAESSLSIGDEQALEEVLVDYLNQQHRRKDEIIHQSPLHQMAFEEFYSLKPATVKKKINAHLKKIKDHRQSLDLFLEEVKTLKRLKEVLSERYDAHIFRGGW